MKILNGTDVSCNFAENLRPLFEAMKEGRAIKTLTFCAGETNKDDRTKDFIINDFRALEYNIDTLRSGDPTKCHDLVLTDQNRNGYQMAFFISWVISFELT